MTALNVEISVSLDQRFRDTVYQRKGLRKGAITEAVTEALKMWISSPTEPPCHVHSEMRFPAGSLGQSRPCPLWEPVSAGGEKAAPHVAIRPELLWFAEQMEKKLRENDHKGGWENEPVQYFIDRMKDEMEEIEGAIANLMPLDGDLIDLVNECTDLANFAMMLAENAHRKAMEWYEEEAERGRES